MKDIGIRTIPAAGAGKIVIGVAFNAAISALLIGVVCTFKRSTSSTSLQAGAEPAPLLVITCPDTPGTPAPKLSSLVIVVVPDIR